MAPGAAISIVAPSSPFDRARFDRGIEALRSLGYQPILPEAIFSRWPAGEHAFLAGDDARRLAELRAALADPGTQALVLARGGYGAMRIAGQLSLEEIARANKPIAGYSDATVLHELWWRAGVRSIHGPMCTQLGEDPSALSRFAELLAGNVPASLTWTPLDQLDQNGKFSTAPAEGPLRGGNLATLASLCGTPLQPSFANAIVLLEDLNEPPYRLDRLCTQLLQSGALAGARGFVIGDLWGPNESSAGRAEVLAERLGPLGVPLAFGAPFGHANRNQPVLFGAVHRLDAERGTLEQSS